MKTFDQFLNETFADKMSQIRQAQQQHKEMLRQKTQERQQRHRDMMDDMEQEQRQREERKRLKQEIKQELATGNFD